MGDVKPLINEQAQAMNQMVDYVKKAWKTNDVDQNSALTSIVNSSTGSKIIFDNQKKTITYDKNYAIDPKPISLNSTFEQFKTWFDSNNNYNPVSGLS